MEISLAGERVSDSLDGNTIFEDIPVHAAAAPKVEMVYGFDKKAGEIVVKCINPVAAAVNLQRVLNGTSVPSQKARRITLTGEGSAP